MSELRRLAEAVGLLTGYHANTGAWVEPSDEDLLATLQRFGVDIDAADDPASLLADIERRSPTVEPVIVAWGGRLAPVPVASGLPVCLLRLESGAELDLPVRNGRAQLERARLPLGRHELLVTDAEGVEHAAVVLAAPEVAWRPAPGTERRWGIFVPTYALRRNGSPAAIGDLADLEAAFDWLHGEGGQVVVTLPMLATFLDEPADISPYAPISRRFWNELYADVRAVAGRGGIDLGDADEALVDYGSAWEPRRRAIATLADRLLDDAELEHWLRLHPEVDTYARFRAAGARHGRNWRAWPSRLPGDGDPAEVRFHRTAQWLMDRQLARLHRKVGGRGQLLALDLPVGSHPDGFDVWEQRDLFVDGVSVGAPPDSFFSLGQDWGFPPVHPQRSREQGHAFLQACIRHHVQHAGLLRVDHILGLLRQYWVRDDAGPRRGVYVRYPLEELLAVISLEAARAGAVVVGENLGTVPPEVTAAMTEHGVMGCAVGQFDVWDVVHDERPIPVPPPASIATLNTHDTATFAAFWSGGDADDRAELGLLDAEELAAEHARREHLRVLLRARLGLDEAATSVDAAAALLEVASAGDAGLVVLNVEDGWAERHPQNVPGTVHERPNWRRRVEVPVEEWPHHEGLGQLVDAVRRHRPGWSRRPQADVEGWRAAVADD